MILIKSFHERQKKEQTQLEYLYNKRFKKFTFLPKRMNDDSFVWLQFVFVEYWIVKYGNEFIDKNEKFYFYTEKGKQ